MADNQQYKPGVSLAGAVDLESLKHQVAAQPGQAGGAPKAGAYVIDTTENTFQAMVQTSTTFPILLLLWNTTDDRMVDLARRLGDAVNAQKGKIQLSRIDVDNNPSVAQALRVREAPAIFGLVGGRPIPVIQGLPGNDEITEIIEQVIPQLVAVAQKSGVSGTAPYSGDPKADEQAAQSAEETATPPEHAEAEQLVQQGDYAGAAEAYGRVLENNPNDALASRERSKALLLARSGKADVRKVRAEAADHPDDVDAQLADADIDMIGGQISDAFGRLLDYVANGHRDQIDPVRKRLLEYFAIPEPSDERLRQARRRLAALMY